MSNNPINPLFMAPKNLNQEWTHSPRLMALINRRQVLRRRASNLLHREA